MFIPEETLLKRLLVPGGKQMGEVTECRWCKSRRTQVASLASVCRRLGPAAPRGEIRQ